MVLSFDCGDEKIKSTIVDMIMFTELKDHNCNSDPLIFLGCGHFFAISTLDGMLELNRFYDAQGQNEDGVFSWRACRSFRLEGELQNNSKNVCPNCRKPITTFAADNSQDERTIYRYKRPLNAAMVDVTTRKFIQMGHTLLRQAFNLFEKAKATLGDRRIKFLSKLVFSDIERASGGRQQQPSSKTKKGQSKSSSTGMTAMLQSLVETHLPSSTQDFFNTFFEEILRCEREYEKVAEMGLRPPTIDVYEAAKVTLERNQAVEKLGTMSAPTQQTGVGDDEAFVSPSHRAQGLSLEVPDPDTTFFLDGSVGVISTMVVIFEEIKKHILPKLDVLSSQSTSSTKSTSSTPTLERQNSIQRCFALFARSLIEEAVWLIDQLQPVAIQKHHKRRVAQNLLLKADLNLRNLSLLINHPKCFTDAEAGFVLTPSATADARAKADVVSSRIRAKVLDFVEEARKHAPLSIKDIVETDGASLKKKAEQIVKRARGEPFYDDVTLEEKLSIFNAMREEFYGSGHFYRCPQGHVVCIYLKKHT
ncbi:hypothetical protein HK102_009382 [Quaeritorhiza haematococci]|nr:hypothetical protein HK102_009382 [Quaeritorhiza haematococci]